MDISIGFAKENISFSIDDKNLITVLEPNPLDGPVGGRKEVTRSLENPIGAPRLSQLVKPGEKVVMITSDITRPVPSYDVIPPILDELSLAGVQDEDITLVFALGSHRAHTEEEQIRLIGQEVFDRIHCLDFDPNDTVLLGHSSAGTPYEVFRPVAEADRLICIGNIEFHYFAGYSGGAKAVMPGVCNRSSIQSNHSMMIQEGAETGRIEGNPVRKDIDEVAAFRPIDYIVNVVLDAHKKILKSYAGHYIEAHRAGCAFLDTLYKVPIQEKADIVIVSVGGYPKDLNLYQAQKGLDNAKFAVKDGGTIILCASCKEGLGEGCFERWMTGFAPEERITQIRKNFQLGGHKAAAIAMVAKQADISLVSELPEDFVKSLYLTPFTSLDDALASAFAKYGEDARVIVMPYAGSTLPTYTK
ncbi:MAG: nickel-dependent lactate racemase [Ruminococcaceae bacterium]|nr:nickel-dependent lactate racemase [Oscillospiraceae bacterium]